MMMSKNFLLTMLILAAAGLAAEKNTFATVDSLTGRAEVQRAGTQA